MQNITERSLLARIKRRLSHDDLVIRKTRENSRWLNDLGYYHMIDVRRNALVGTHISLEEQAREEGVLKPAEVVAWS